MNVPVQEELGTLLTRLADGDRSVFSLVFRRLWGPTHRFCTSLLKNEADASDAAQQAMEKILERASDYDPTRSPMPWALAIAAWECRTLRRKRFRRREADEREMGEPATDGAEDEIQQRDMARAAVTAMGELSKLDQETLLASFWDESTTATGTTLRKRRERALERLRGAFRRLYGFG